MDKLEDAVERLEKDLMHVQASSGGAAKFIESVRTILTALRAAQEENAELRLKADREHEARYTLTEECYTGCPHMEDAQAENAKLAERVRELEKELDAEVEQKIRAIFNLGWCKALLNTANFNLKRSRHG